VVLRRGDERRGDAPDARVARRQEGARRNIRSLRRRRDDSDDEFWASLGKKCLHFTWSTRGPIPLDGLNLETVTDPDEADFLLAHGTEAVNGAGTTDEQRAQGAVDTSLDAMRELLKRAAARNLPLIVANPDVVTVGGDAGLLPDARHAREVVRRDGHHRRRRAAHGQARSHHLRPGAGDDGYGRYTEDT
jgi:hypothetical protein